MGPVTKWSVTLVLPALLGGPRAREYGGALGGLMGRHAMLQDTIVVRDAQEGFVGVTGELWSIAPSGKWQIARFVNDKTDLPYRQGRLAPEQLLALTRVLQSQSFAELPDSFGRDVKVNRHLITISVGKKRSTLVLNAGELATRKSVSEADAQAKLWCRFLSIIDTVQSLLKDSDKQ